ncbi:MAG: endonuclease/exonuclease/phosphatase family protein, partial [Candidatus Thiodiazotropha sp.]
MNDSNQNVNISNVNKLRVVSYNCKNMATAGLAFEHLAKEADIILVQEHWYFDCQLDKLNSVTESLIGCGKAVDTGNPVLPLQMPRGYGGTAVMWQKSIDHLIVPLPDGGNRIQYVETKGQDPLLLVSVYMPCKGLQDSVENYEDCLAQLSEIVAKFSSSHSIIVGGDFNEDMVKQSKRLRVLSDFITENKLQFNPVGKTYVNPDGVETSTIDYIFYDQKMKQQLLSAERLSTIHTNVSDHLPVRCTFEIDLQHIQETDKILPPSNKIKWDKINKVKYEQVVTEKIAELNGKLLSRGALDVRVQKVNEILVQA